MPRLQFLSYFGYRFGRETQQLLSRRRQQWW